MFASAIVSQPGATGEDRGGPEFENAAKKNSVLMNSLKWNWGKTQTGWYLYVPLLKKTLSTGADPESAEFAGAVARWQIDQGEAATGILDRKTLFLLIGHWQSQRIDPIYEAKPTSLLSAPIAEFYDRARARSLLKVDREAYNAYREMLAEARKDLFPRENEQPDSENLYLKIISSYRSPAYQAELRKKEPGATRAQIAFRSPHFTGRALDIYVGGEPVSTKDSNRAVQIRSAAYLWLVENAERFGFYPYFYEPWHWEFTGKRLMTEN
ncbi:MAG: D-alanyl-D-alanine carboxypeptidase family protein [Acidobacteriota bacterium]|nr:D-alanyl-D-alanine carboxypeptidase family protein [Acidobacteriota bacterium]MDH3529123.1 D-alanyl-D-alanine carboxypeptidase family protein [Acidobacteriota bacterium]